MPRKSTLALSILSTVLLVEILLLFLLRAPTGVRYQIVNIGSFCADGGYAWAINNRGEVSGWDGAGGAFAWSTSAGMMHLGTLGGKSSAGLGINDLGCVVGMSETGREGRQAFIWSATDGMRGLATIEGETTYAHDINNAMQVVGSSEKAGVDRVVCWNSSGDMTELEKAVGEFPFAAGWSLNDRGDKVGSIDEGARRSFVWKPDGDCVEICGVDGGLAAIRDINNNGVVVGSLWNETRKTLAFQWIEGQSIPLESLGAHCGSRANAINNLGQIVGADYFDPDHWSRTAHLIYLGFRNSPRYGIRDARGQLYEGDRAVLWQDGEVYNLNHLIPRGTGWHLEEARDINDRGQIVGTGICRGHRKPFLLNPIPETGDEKAHHQ